LLLRLHRVGKILPPIVLLLRLESVHSDEYDFISSTTTVRRTQSHTVTSLEPNSISTTTVQFPLSSTVPSLAPGYSSASTDGELISIGVSSRHNESSRQDTIINSIIATTIRM
jgi:hypothetical protein